MHNFSERTSRRVGHPLKKASFVEKQTPNFDRQSEGQQKPSQAVLLSSMCQLQFASEEVVAGLLVLVEWMDCLHLVVKQCCDLSWKQELRALTTYCQLFA